jgi:hypothetical protein
MTKNPMFYLMRRKMSCERKSIRTSTNDYDEAFAHNIKI